MSLPVHLVPSLEGVTGGSAVEVSGDEAHHAVAVRRLWAGERVVLTDGAGTVATGAVATTGTRVFVVEVEDVRREPRPEPELVVVQALPKGDRGELAVEVLTEVGAGTIVPWAAGRSVAVWKGDRAHKAHARWQTTAREAAKQARRPWHPDVAPLARTADVAGLVAAADLALVLHEAATEPLSGLDVPASGTVVLVVGPEGGLTDDEIAAFVDAGARAVRLGPEVLRTSTAGLAGAAAVLARTARWG